jgi:wyosine [tRNA(Phe)-imidazoG37] synthetase (radical SAM superfamily)
MIEHKYVYGPVPSRRMGLSLGISPIPKKTCNYSCVYCQLGRTDKMTNRRQMFFDSEAILSEFDQSIASISKYDVVTLVGEGEPTLYLGLYQLIKGIKERTDKPVALITNGALLYDEDVVKALNLADIVLPTFDATDESLFSAINRPHGSLTFELVNEGLKKFSHQYPGELWLEMMFLEGINDSEENLMKYREMLKEISYERLYLNTPVRPPAEDHIKPVSSDFMAHASEVLGGISIDLLSSVGFFSHIKDDYQAILSIIKRHPMHQFEIESFLETRKASNIPTLMKRLGDDPEINSIDYKGYTTYRLK